MAIDSERGLMVLRNLRTRMRTNLSSWAMVGLVFLVAAGVPGALPSLTGSRLSSTLSSLPSPDRLFFSTRDSPVVSIDVATGQIRTWPLDIGDADAVDWYRGSAWNIAVAHDGQQVAYATRKDLHPWRLRVTDGVSSKEIGSLEGLAWVASLAWSPDDREIAFLGSYDDGSLSGDNTHLAVMNVATGAVEDVMEPVYAFAWRPGSREIVFSVAHGASMGLYWVDEKREVFRRLRHFEWGVDLALAMDGRELLYDAIGEFQPSFLNLDSGQGRKIGVDAIWGASAWSPDGHSIVVVRDREFVTCEHTILEKGGLAIVDAVTGEARLLDNEAIASPAWSPDGRSIAYIRIESCDQGTAAVAVVDVNSGEQKVFESGLTLDSEIWAWR